MRKNSFSKKERLKKNSLIKEVFKKGILFRGRLFEVYFLKRETGPEAKRVAFTVRKNLYNKKPALRNRFRRILREAYRKTKCLLSGRYDIVILGTHLTKHTKSIVIEQEMTYVFKKCNNEGHKILS